MDLATYKARRAALPTASYRQVCQACRKTLSTCYCGLLKPFCSPVAFVILQHEAEARNAIATARMAHLSMTNSQLIVGRGFDGHPLVDRLIAAPECRNLMLYPSPDATPIEQVFAGLQQQPAAKPPVFWLLDAKWAQVPKMLRLSPNIRRIEMVAFQPGSASRFQLRRQPKPACLSTLEAIHLVIERYLQCTGQQFAAHHTLIEVFEAFVRQQLDFVDPVRATRHAIAKARRRERRGPPLGAGKAKL